MRFSLRYRILAVAFVLAACRSNEDKQRAEELALKERELALRERELAAKGSTAADGVPVAPQANPDPASLAKAAQAKAPSGATTASPNAAAKAERREVNVTIQVTFDQSKIDGKPWDVDIGGGAPDPLVSTRVSGNGATWAAQLGTNTYSGAATTAMALLAGDTVTITAWDKDVAANDLGGNFVAAFPGSSTSVKGRGGAVSFVVTFQVTK